MTNRRIANKKNKTSKPKTKLRPKRLDMPNIQTNALAIKGLSGLSYEVLRDRKTCLCREKAEWYIDLPIFDGERSVVDAHVQNLYDEMNKGNFAHLNVIMSTAVLDGKEYKINGQHTCWAVWLMTEKDPGYSINVREIKYGVKDEEQLRRLYSVQDRNKVRTNTHLTQVQLVKTKEMIGISNTLMLRMTPALRFWQYPNKDERRRIGPEEVQSLFRFTHNNMLHNVSNFLDTKENRQFEKFWKKQPVLAAMMETFEKVPTKAPQFWQPVLNGLGLDTMSDPRWKLRNFIDNCALARSATNTHKKIVNSEELYRTCVYAWGKWRQGEEIKVFRAPTKRTRAI